MKEGTSIKDYLDKFNKIIMDTKNIYVRIHDEGKTILLIYSLPYSYKDFIDVTMYNNDTLSIHDIKVALNRKEVKKKVSKSGEGNSSEDLVIEGVQERKIMRGKVNLDLNQSSRETTNVLIATKKIL